MNEDHFVVQNGQMYQMKNKEKTQLKDKYVLQNGSILYPDGNLQIRDGKRLQLRDGECMDMQGNRYDSQDRFRDRMEKRNMDRMERDKIRENNTQENRNPKQK